MFFGQKEIELTKVDLTLWTTIFVVSNYLFSMHRKVPVFDNAWQLFTLSSLLGFVLHGLVVSKITPSLTDLTPDRNTKNAIVDVVKFGTVFATRKALIDYFNNQPINLTDNEWLTEQGLILGGYAVFHIVARDMLPKLDESLNPLLSDGVEFSMGYLLAKFIMRGTVSEDNLYELGSYLAGFAAYYLGIKYLFTPQAGQILSDVAAKSQQVISDVAPKVGNVLSDVANKSGDMINKAISKQE